MKYRLLDFFGHKVLEVQVFDDIEIINKAECVAKAKSEFIKVGDPSGRPRSLQEVFSQNFLGALADIVCAEVIKRYFEKKSILVSVIRYDDIRSDEYRAPDLFDIKLVCGQNEYIVEVRSSVCVFLSLENMVKKWQILGSYSSEVKGNSEQDKSFYIRPIFHLNRYLDNRKEQFYKRDSGFLAVKKGDLSLYIVGGATGSLLLERGRNEQGEELKQGKSEFNVIDILDGYDVEKFLSVVEQTVTRSHV